MRSLPLLRSLLLSTTIAIVVAAFARDADACGGCFHAEVPTTIETPSVVTDHRMVISISAQSTTLWDQVEYAGDPKDFAWVLPVRGAVVVGLGSDAFIDALDQRTAPQVDSPRVACPSPGGGGCLAPGVAGCGSSSSGDDVSLGYQEDAGIFVTGRSTAGPYAVVQVHGTDEGAIVGWLRDHHYVVPTEIEPILARYVVEGFDFVAVRLRPGEGVKAMQPIRVSWRGAIASLPLRMVAAGVGTSVGIKLFVIGDGRWTTENFPSFEIDPSVLTWDFATQRSDYTAWRQRLADKWSGRAFALESSIDMPASALPRVYPPRDWGDGGADSADDSGLDASPSDAPSSDADIDADAEASPPDTTPPPTYDAGPPPVVDPYASDVDIAFAARFTRRVTRLRADLPTRFLDADLLLQADANQSQLPIVVQPRQSVNLASLCGAPPAAASRSSRQQRGCAVGETPSSVLPPALGLFAIAAAATVGRRVAKGAGTKK